MTHLKLGLLTTQPIFLLHNGLYTVFFWDLDAFHAYLIRCFKNAEKNLFLIIHIPKRIWRTNFPLE